MHSSLAKSAKGAIPLHAVKASDLKRWMGARGKREAQWLKAAGFSAREGELLLVPAADGRIAFAVLGLGEGRDRFALAAFSEQLAAGTYALADVPDGADAALAWILGTYKFTRYKKNAKEHPKLVLPKGVDSEEATRIAEGVFLGRDLINTPSNDMGPEELAGAARDLAKRHGAKFSVIVGDALLKAN